MYRANITHDEVEALPYVAFGGKITVIDRPEKVAAAVAALAGEKFLGYDTESRPSFTRGVKYGVSLVQLSSAEEAFLFRIDKIGMPKELVALMQDADVLKIGAAVGEDIHGMQRVGRFVPRSFVDLQKMVEAYKIEEKSLKKMAAIVLNLRISKSQQTSNWSLMRYSSEQKLYAATDAWVCREIYFKLMAETPLIPFEKLEMNADGTLVPKPPKVRSRPKTKALSDAADSAKSPAQKKRHHRGGRRHKRKSAAPLQLNNSNESTL